MLVKNGGYDFTIIQIPVVPLNECFIIMHVM